MYQGLSVVVCTYNGALYLREQIDSLLSQTLLPDEILIHDDGSTDDTLKIAQEYAAKDARFRVVSNEGMHGVNGNFFAALKAAKGELIAICDQDDIWLPTKLEKQVAALCANPEALLCGCVSQPFSEGDVKVKVDLRMPCLSPLRMMYVGMMPGHTMLLRRELLSLVPNGDFFMYDLQLQVTAALLGSIVYVQETLVHQRRYGEATTYMRPQTPFGIIKTAFANYRALRPQVVRRFHHWENFLMQFAECMEVQKKSGGISPKSPPVLQEKSTGFSPKTHRLFSEGTSALYEEAFRMTRLQIRGGYFRLLPFCLKHHGELQHARSKNAIVSLLRAAIFPITCCNYYRYLLGQPCPQDWKTED